LTEKYIYAILIDQGEQEIQVNKFSAITIRTSSDQGQITAIKAGTFI